MLRRVRVLGGWSVAVDILSSHDRRCDFRLVSGFCGLVRITIVESQHRWVPVIVVGYDGARFARCGPARLFQLPVEGRRARQLLLRQFGCEFCLVADLDLTDRHGDELIADTKEPADREDHRGYAGMVQINQNVLDLADRCVTL
jgi:hypothetical protein